MTGCLFPVSSSWCWWGPSWQLCCVTDREKIAHAKLMISSLTQENAVLLPRPPRPTRGISQKDTSLPLDRIKKLGRTLTVQHLRDIVDLPTSFSADLDVLKRRAVAAAKVVPDGNTDGYVVKYYSGVNHTHHRLLENGVTGFASKPLAGVYFTEHCFDGDGKIVKAIANDKDGTRFVDRTFWYEGNRPSAMLTYGPSGYSFGEHGLYREGRLYLVARFDAIGTKLIV